MQIEEMGFLCRDLIGLPHQLGMNALEANRRVEEEMIPYFPLAF